MADEIVTKSERNTEEQAVASQTWKRRGLLTAAWAAVAAIVVKQTTQPVEALDPNDVVLGVANTTTGFTSITNTVINNTGFGGFGTAAGSWGLYGEGIEAGVVGVQRSSGAGVWGSCDNGVGVLGQSAAGSAVRGEISSGSAANAIAVYGTNDSSYTGGGPGAGGFGVYGISTRGHGLVGATGTAGGAAVVGATNGVTGAYAATFYGPVVVTGNFAVVGSKSAAVPHPDGSHRLLYCMESPESWFEDFGKGQLACGQVDVTIDPDFAAVADLTDYHVFLTGYDDFELRVSEQTATGFRVQAKDAASEGRFSWRVVAKRKDIVGERLAKVTVPSEPQLPSMHQDFAPPAMRPEIRVRQQRVG